MSAKPKFKQASFRGVPFQIRSSEGEFGRRTADHEFVQRETPFTEDMGKRAQGFTVEGFVIGDNYLDQKDALIKAIETAGPGPLVHPFYGIKQVVCKSCRVRETAGELRMASFEMQFREEGLAAFPDPKQDAVSGLLASIQSATAAINNEFANAFSVANKPAYLLDQAESLLGSATDLVGSIAKNIRGEAQAIADFAYRIRNIKAGIRDIINTPGQLAQQFSDSIALLEGVFPGGSGKAVVSAYQVISDFGAGLPTVPSTTANRSQEAQNQESIVALLRRLGIINACGAAAQTTFQSFDDAAATRDALSASIESELETASDDVYSSLQDLKARLFDSVPPDGQDLPHIVSYIPMQTIPSLVLAYELYGSIDLEPDVVARNSIAHPGFIPGGVALQVLQES